jgi:hypothetical protein
MSEYKEYTVKVFSDRTEWYNDKGQYHREDGPAIEYANGTKSWYKNDFLHREDGLAIEYVDGHKSWYLEGKEYTEEEYNKKMNKSSCNGKVVEIEGKKYKLVEKK